jgi:hypothetical protein
MTAAVPPPTDLKSALEAMRASVAAQGARKGLAARVGLAGAIQEAVLGLLSLLLAMLEDFRAGRLAPIAPVAEAAGAECAVDGAPAVALPGFVGANGVDATVAPSSARRFGAGIGIAWARLWERNGDNENGAPCGPVPRFAGLDREAAQRPCGADGAVAHPPPQPPGSILGSRPRTGRCRIPAQGGREKNAAAHRARCMASTSLIAARARMAERMFRECFRANAVLPRALRGQQDRAQNQRHGRLNWTLGPSLGLSWPFKGFADAMAGYARHGPGFPALQGAIF